MASLFVYFLFLSSSFFANSSTTNSNTTCVPSPPGPPPPAPNTTDPQVVDPIYPLIVVYRNGTIVRVPQTSPPPNPSPDPATGVIHKDITLNITTNLTARIFIVPSMLEQPNNERFPIVVHFHGGAFIFGSPFDGGAQASYLNRVILHGRVILISINYRMFPEFTIPTPYDDSWSALQWVSSRGDSSRRSTSTNADDSWLVSRGDFSRVFITGESAGANIVHNMAMRLADEPLPNGVSFRGAFLGAPYFLGSKPVPSEPCSEPQAPSFRVWKYACPRITCPNGVDDPVMNPSKAGHNLSRLATKRMMIYTSDLDDIHGRAFLYKDSLEKSGWPGKVRLFEAIGGGHAFQTQDRNRTHKLEALTNTLITRFVKFIHHNQIGIN